MMRIYLIFLPCGTDRRILLHLDLANCSSSTHPQMAVKDDHERLRLQGRGVAMAMYNTDEVNEICRINSVAYTVVHYGFCICVIQDGAV